jgi:hypothetical protein
MQVWSQAHVEVQSQPSAKPEGFDPAKMVATMQLAADMGRTVALAAMIECRGPMIRKGSDVSHHLALDVLETFLADAINVERVHGNGCILQLQHPLVQEIIKRGRIPSSEVDAALRYSVLKATHAPEIGT